MKRLLFAFVFNCIIGVTFAQFSSNEGVKASFFGNNLMGVEEVFLFNGNMSSATISYSHTANTNFKWYKYTNNIADKVEVLSENNTSTTTLSDLDAGVGYELEFDGQSIYIWVIDMTLYPINFYSLTVAPETDCVTTYLNVNVAGISLSYKTPTGIIHTLPRNFTLSYTTLDDDFAEKTITISKTIPFTSIAVEAPLCDTKFILVGDQYLSYWGVEKKIESVKYSAVAVKMNLKGQIIERTAKNELDRTKGNIGGSAPLDIDFTSNANEPVAKHYEWYITDLSTLFESYYTDKNLRYTFQNSGQYKVKLRTSNANATCEVKDSITVTAIESYIEVPNVFTPNGDGKNDEFRVAYKSISKFNMIVYNRWGRIVYQSTDPGRGWDGRIGGRMASPAAYYYVIEATGTDKDSKGNYIRYKLQGDINLLRNK